MVQIERVNFGGWPNSYRISNGEVELVITSDIGPRIMRYAFVDGQNMFKEFTETLGSSGEEHWVLRGGHRLWVAPEDRVRTYAPDNGPVRIEVKSSTLEAIQPVEPLTGLEKQMVITLAPGGTAVQVLHRIRNATATSVHLAAWTPTMMAPGGVGITGFPPRGKHPDVLLPTNPLVMWAFTDLSDPRLQFTRKYLVLRQDPNNAEPQKLGLFNPHTWGAYLLGSDLFIKSYEADCNRPYPDFGVSFEIFTNADFLELETLGPLGIVEPGAAVEHIETWRLFKNIRIRKWTDAELDQVFGKLLWA